MFTDFLANRIKKAIKKSISKNSLNKENIKAVLQEIRVALLEADVNFNVVKDFISEVARQAEGEFIDDGLNPEQMMIKIVHKQLTAIMGHKVHELQFNKKPTIIMVVGLQGSGKTTTIAKLSSLISKKYNKKSLLIAADIYRPAAIEQLKILGEKINTEVYAEINEKDVVKIVQNGIKYGNDKKYDVILVDTAGRLHIDEVLMLELKNLKAVINPQEIIIVVDGMTGQSIIEVTEQFNEQLKLSGTIISKLDGDARGGAALSISHLTKLPILFAGVGEGISSLEIFYPERMADRILGMGDVMSLVEKAQDVVDERTAKKTMERMMRGQFDLDDLKNQMAQMSKMGKLGTIMKMMPGAPKMSDDKIDEAEAKLKVTAALLDSMTIKERRNPKIVKYPSRKERIIKGSGRSARELNQLLDQFDKSKKMVDQIGRDIKAGKMPNFGKMN